jgi:hypothetical protein
MPDGQGFNAGCKYRPSIQPSSSHIRFFRRPCLIILTLHQSFLNESTSSTSTSYPLVAMPTLSVSCLWPSSQPGAACR